MSSNTNRLIHESSPYLRQHAHNPVDWHIWGEEALQLAKAADKPILVSIGYASCHWCHVMERESFEDEHVADYMNRHFVCVKVDREERPDVDNIYMEAVQIMTGAGGWPLNCFLLPDGRPFYGGTYYPPRPAYNRPSWTQVLHNIVNAYHNRREEVEKQAARLTEAVRNADDRFVAQMQSHGTQADAFAPDLTDAIFNALYMQFDKAEGGFGHAPKFPTVMALEFLLHYYYHAKNEQALAHVRLSLDKMLMGGIYDQLGGGFSRYSTDSGWLVPHFEKMLYDNALLVSLLAQAYQCTGESSYKETIEQTLAFIAREMTSPEGGFFSAIDADSEGHEGHFYIWDKEEVTQVLGDDCPLFCEFYRVCGQGNWEGRSILWRKHTYSEFAQAKGMPEDELHRFMESCRQRLFAVRQKRTPPALDDKILLDWNALQCSAYARAYFALGVPDYKDAALRNIHFLLQNFQAADGRGLVRVYAQGKAKQTAFLDDYAFLIAALLDVYQLDFDERFLELAKKYADFAVANFWDEQKSNFFFTLPDQTEVPVRKKDLFDSATPSGNATMVRNLQQLGLVFGDEGYSAKASAMLQAMKNTIERLPLSFSKWATAMLSEVYGNIEVAVVGEAAQQMAHDIQRVFLPNGIVMAAQAANGFPMLQGREPMNGTQVHVCTNSTCKRPVETAEAAIELLRH
jgi:uncharacterized protein YyaL (SSP411 family)